MEGFFLACLFLAYVFGGGAAGIYLTLWVLFALSAVFGNIAGISFDMLKKSHGDGDTTFTNLCGSVVALVVMWIAYGVSTNWDTLVPYILR